MEHYPFGEKGGDYLLYVGRIAMEKGVHFAIEVAEQLDLPLIIAAKVDVSDQPYFRAYIEPRLSDRIQWIGEVEEEERNKLMAGAKCFLHPVTWREPFGLTLIEAMACGSPVVAFNRGSIPEIIKTGVTGYVVEDTESMIDAVDGIGAIDRKACREHALKNFSAQKMTDGYEAIYKKLV
jgi:glycosyltransferase involved in cell wall biosynthesis